MKKLSSLLTTGYLLLATAPAVLAQDVVGKIQAPGTVIDEPTQVGSFISIIIRFLIVVAGLYALLQLILGGFGYVSSSGDKSKVQENTQRMLYAIIGLAAIGISFIITSLIGRLIFGEGFDLLAPQLQTL